MLLYILSSPIFSLFRRLVVSIVLCLPKCPLYYLCNAYFSLTHNDAAMEQQTVTDLMLQHVPPASFPRYILMYLSLQLHIPCACVSVHILHSLPVTFGFLLKILLQINIFYYHTYPLFIDNSKLQSPLQRSWILLPKAPPGPTMHQIVCR